MIILYEPTSSASPVASASPSPSEESGAVVSASYDDTAVVQALHTTNLVGLAILVALCFYVMVSILRSLFYDR